MKVWSNFPIMYIDKGSTLHHKYVHVSMILHVHVIFNVLDDFFWSIHLV
jgi:hypothetical protein